MSNNLVLEGNEEKRASFISPLEIETDLRKRSTSPSSSPYHSPFHYNVKQKLIRIDNDESQQYEEEESEVWWHHQLQRFPFCICAISFFVLKLCFFHQAL
jgi:hypothetical protein